MRLNQYLAKHTGLGRRSADQAILDGRVMVNGAVAIIGQVIDPTDAITLDGQEVAVLATTTIALNKPAKTICSRTQQGNVPTIYSLLPPELQHLTYLGRLDKDTTGLLIMTNDGDLIEAVSHPKREIDKKYKLELDKPLSPHDQEKITKGVKLDDGLSRLHLEGGGKTWTATLHEGRNRQIRRTFAALGYHVQKLHRFQVGKLLLPEIAPGNYTTITNGEVL